MNAKPVDSSRSLPHRMPAPSGLPYALVGAALWAFGVALLSIGLAESLFLLGPLVAVPLGLPLLAAEGESGRRPRGSWRALLRLQLPAACLLLASWAFPPGAAAALLGAPWLVFAAIGGILGARRAVEGRGPWPQELSYTAAQLFLVVGAVWTLAWRGGFPLLGFSGEIVLFTAAHFHFAGFALPVLAGRAARAVPGKLACAAACGAAAGVPFVAAGITLSARGVHGPELAAALWMAAAGLVVAALQVVLAGRLESRTRSLLLAVSAAALAFGMVLAALWDISEAFGLRWISIPQMVLYHATANVLGFALPGLVSWSFAAEDREGALPAGPHSAGMRLLLPWLGDAPGLEEWEDREFAHGAVEGPRPGDARDAWEIEIGVETSGPPVPGGLHQRAAERILAFKVFPETLLRGVLRRSPVETSDTVAGVYPLLPGVALVFGARVVDRFDGAQDGVWRTGFTYRTLAGHPFAGEETFSVEKSLETGSVVVALRSWSRPAAAAVRVFYRLARRFQEHAARAALRSLQAADTVHSSSSRSSTLRNSTGWLSD